MASTKLATDARKRITGIKLTLKLKYFKPGERKRNDMTSKFPNFRRYGVKKHLSIKPY